MYFPSSLWFRLRQKRLSSVLIVLLLLVGLAITLFLIKQRLDQRIRAQGTPSILYDSFDKTSIDTSRWEKQDTESKINVKDGMLQILSEKSVTKWSDPALYSVALLPRTAGRALVGQVRPTVHTAIGPLIHFSPTKFPTSDARKEGYGITFDQTGTIPFLRFNAVVPGAMIPYTNNRPNEYDPATAKSIDYMTTTVLRPTGSYHLVTGGDFGTYPTATLIWVNDHGSDSNLYAGVNDYNSNSQIGFVRVVDLPGDFTGQWGLATSADAFNRTGDLNGSQASEKGNQTWTATGSATTDGAMAILPGDAKSIVQTTSDGIFEADMTSSTSGAFAGGIIFRQSDPQNFLYFLAEDYRWRYGAVQNGQDTIIYQTGANLFGYNQTKRLRVKAHGDYICFYANDSSPLDCTKNSFNTSATGVGIGNFGQSALSFDNFASWPRTITLPTTVGNFPTIPSAQATEIVKDSFNASDNTQLVNHPLDTGGSWIMPRGTWEIKNNQATPVIGSIPKGYESVVVTQANQKDIAVSADITLPDNSGPTGWFAGLVIRYKDINNFVWARFTGDTNKGTYTAEIELFEVVNGQNTPLCFTIGCITNATNLTNILLPNKTYKMTLVALGNQIAVYMDGKLIVQGRIANLDGTFAGLSIAQAADAISTYDNFTVTTVTPESIPPPEVTDLSVSLVSDKPKLDWSVVFDDASGTTFYRVFRSTNQNDIGTQINTDGQTTNGTYTDTSVDSGTYYYTVFAVDKAGNVSSGGDNKQVSITVVATNPTPTPIPAGSFYDTFFPYGPFEGTGTGNPTQMTSLIDDVAPRDMDSLHINNGQISAPSQQQMLTVADQKNFNLSYSPAYELERQWWNPANYDNPVPPQTVDGAKSIAGPLIDLMKIHPSIKAYSLADDADAYPLTKRNLLQQAFYELDPTRITTMIEGRSPDRYDLVNSVTPRAMLLYQYPAGANKAACDFTHLDYGQMDWVDRSRVRRQFMTPNTPFWQVLQTHQTQKNKDGVIIDSGPTALRYPTVEELRLEQWLAVGEGATGIFWFTYSDQIDANPAAFSWIGFKNNPSFYTEITDLSHRLKPLRPLLTQLKKVDDKFTISGSGKTYVSTFKHKTENKYYVLATNFTCSTQNVTLNTKYFTGQLKDLESGVTQSITTPFSLRGGDGKLFELVSPGLVNPQPPRDPIVNLIQNPSFETLDGNGKPLSWQGAIQASYVDSTTAHTGTKSIKIVGPNPTDGGIAYFGQVPGVQAGKKYMLSLWAKTQNIPEVILKGINARFVMTSPRSEIYPFEPNDEQKGTHEWRHVFTIFKVPSDYAAGRLDITFSIPSGATGWIDDVELCELNESCSPMPFEPLGAAPSPSPTTQPSPTPIPGGAVKVPSVPIDYTKDVETWWSTHPLNPDGPNGIPIGAIQSPQNVINVKQQYNSNIQAAIDALPTTGGTLYFEPGTYQHNEFQIIGKENVHFLSDGGATILGGPQTSDSLLTPSTIASCPEAVDYGAFNSMLFYPLDPKHQAAIQCVRNRKKNFYFKNLTFDGNNTAQMAFFIRASQDIVFDNVTFQNFVNPKAKHAGHININAVADNIWCRGCIFKGQQVTAITLDGVNGGGVVKSYIQVPYTNAVLLLTNGDYSIDYNEDGTIERSEQRMAEYNVIYGNTYVGGGGNFLMTGTSANTLVKNNIAGTTSRLANFNVRYPNRPTTYQYYGNMVIGNTITNATYLMSIGADASCSPAYEPYCTQNTPRIGKYTVRDNIVGSTSFIKPVLENTAYLPIDGPNVVTNNCVNGLIYDTQTPCSLTPTPTSTPLPQTPTPTPVPTPAACQFTNAFWNTDTATEGDIMTLTVVGNSSCAGKQVAFRVRENDSILEGGLDDDATIQPANSTFVGTTATTTWIAEYQNDCGGLCNPPEYFFTATLVSDPSVTRRSNDPLLTTSPKGGGSLTPTPTPICGTQINPCPTATKTPTPTIPSATATKTPVPTNTPSPTGIVITTNTPIPPTPTSTPSPLACSISRAYWKTADATTIQGHLVRLVVEGSGNCDLKQVAIRVRENDSILEGGLDEDALIQPSTAFFKGTVATTKWVAEYQNDCGGLCNPPEYFFTATLKGSNSETRSQDPLLVVLKAASELKFKTRLEGLQSTQSDLTAQVLIRSVDGIEKQTSSILLEDTTTGDFLGQAGTTLSPGDYLSVVGIKGHLKKQYAIHLDDLALVTQKDLTDPPLTAGDVIEDNKINALDIGKLIEDYSAEDVTTSPADINEDGLVNALDIGFVISNYFKTGDL